MRPRTYWMIILALVTTLAGQCAGPSDAHAASDTLATATAVQASGWSW